MARFGNRNAVGDDVGLEVGLDVGLEGGFVPWNWVKKFHTTALVQERSPGS